MPVADLCREHEISTATYYNWRSKYGGMDALLISKTKMVAEENRRLKKMYAEMAMQNELLKNALAKSDAAISTVRDSQSGRSDERVSIALTGAHQHQRKLLSVRAQ